MLHLSAALEILVLNSYGIHSWKSSDNPTVSMFSMDYDNHETHIYYQYEAFIFISGHPHSGWCDIIYYKPNSGK